MTRKLGLYNAADIARFALNYGLVGSAAEGLSPGQSLSSRQRCFVGRLPPSGTDGD
jgi:hypothetical protein